MSALEIAEDKRRSQNCRRCLRGEEMFLHNVDGQTMDQFHLAIFCLSMQVSTLNVEKAGDDGCERRASTLSAAV